MSRPDRSIEPDLPAPAGTSWVLERRVLAGPHPRGTLDDILAVGVTCFVDLTEEDAYSARLHERAAALGRPVSHVHMPIADFTVPPVSHMRAILAAIREALDADERVYVHCLAGIGRTGTVVGCLLIEHDVPVAEVLERFPTDLALQREFVARWPRS